MALLVNAGMRVRNALAATVLSILSCFIGFIIGVLFGSNSKFSAYVSGLNAGMFLYISLAILVRKCHTKTKHLFVFHVPTMNETMERHLKVSTKSGLVVLLLQSTGIAICLCLLYIHALYTGDITFE